MRTSVRRRGPPVSPAGLAVLAAALHLAEVGERRRGLGGRCRGDERHRVADADGAAALAVALVFG